MSLKIAHSSVFFPPLPLSPARLQHGLDECQTEKLQQCGSKPLTETKAGLELTESLFCKLTVANENLPSIQWLAYKVKMCAIITQVTIITADYSLIDGPIIGASLVVGCSNMLVGHFFVLPHFSGLAPGGQENVCVVEFDILHPHALLRNAEPTSNHQISMLSPSVSPLSFRNTD
ncbi:unnamed protein product [Boreogadus saida]